MVLVKLTNELQAHGVDAWNSSPNLVVFETFQLRERERAAMVRAALAGAASQAGKKELTAWVKEQGGG